MSEVLNSKNVHAYVHTCTHAHTCARAHTHISTYPAVVEKFAKSFLFTFNIWKCLRFKENIFIKRLRLWKSSGQRETALVHISGAPQDLGRGANEMFPCLKSHARK